MLIRVKSTRSTGLEPVASTVTGWRDNQLHQDPLLYAVMKLHYPFVFVNTSDTILKKSGDGT